MTLWMARGYPSCIYGWDAFTTAQVAGDLPIVVTTSVPYWLLCYWPALGTQDHNAGFSTAGYAFLITKLSFLFHVQLGLMDHGLCTQLYGRLEHATALLYHVLVVQRCSEALLVLTGVLGVLDVLHQSQSMEDWWCARVSLT